jgi:hypothetical protein
LIATNTIAQGDTRAVGLNRMVESGFTITRAIQSRSWPAASAALEYAAVWGTAGPVGEDSVRISDDLPVPRITTLLEPGSRDKGQPVSLPDNAGIAFQGCNILGLGFVVDPGTAHEWIESNPQCAEVLFPYLNSEDLNSRPDCTASRWVIDFNNRSLLEASAFEVPMARVRALVKPERDRNPNKQRRENWWRFTRNAPELRRAIADLAEVLVIGLVSKSVMPARVPNGQVFAHKLAVFATDSFADQAILSSSIHWNWAVKYGSTLETRVNYSPSDVFETFPRPEHSEWVRQIGQVLDEERREIMLRRNLGLTKLYNLINDPQIADASDPDVARMRAIHVELDEAVMDAYRWSDISLDHGFHTYRQMERWTFCPAARVEILDRLLEENHRRAAEEAKQTVKPRIKGRAAKMRSDDQGTLL